MAENDVGGIGVKFTADAAQLKQELSALETRLKAFNEAHGQTKVRMQANLVMPGNRVLQDFRREIEKSFQVQGSAGQIKAKVALVAPTAADIKALSAQIGDVKVKVVGSFEWAAGKQPPKTVTIRVIEEVETKRVRGRGRPVGSGRSDSDEDRGSHLAVDTPSVKGSKKKAEPAVAAPKVGSTTLAAAQTQRTPKSEIYAKNNGWNDQLLLSEFLSGGSSATVRRDIKDELVRRGYDRTALESRLRQGRSGGARGLTGGMTGAYGTGAPQVSHWSQGGVPYRSVLSGPSIRKLGQAGMLNLPARKIYDPYPQTGAIAEAPRFGIKDLGSDSRLSEAALARRLRMLARRITPEAVQAGAGWYRQAGEIAQGLGAGTGLGRHQIGAATAMFSQNAGWAENVRNAQDFFEAFRRGARTVAEVERHVATIRKDLSFNALGLKGRTQMALDVAMASNPREIESVIGGPKGDKKPKARAFYHGLMGDPTAFTVDRHMAMMMSGGTVAGNQRMHTPFQRAGQRVAGEMGMSAADLQAILWTNALGPQFAGADPYGQMRATPGGARGFTGAQMPFPGHLGAIGMPREDPRMLAQHHRSIKRRIEQDLLRMQEFYGVGADLRFRPTSADSRQMAARERRPWAGNAQATIMGPDQGLIEYETGLLSPRGMYQRTMEDRAHRRGPFGRSHVGLGKGEPSSVIRHEFGHLLKAELDELGYQTQTSNVGIRAQGLSTPGRPGGGERISKRAMDSLHEAFAEAFAAVESGEEDVWGVGDLLESVLGVRPGQKPPRPEFGRSGGARGLTGPLKLSTGRNRDTAGRVVRGTDTEGIFAAATHKGNYQTGRTGHRALMDQGIDPLRLLNDLDITDPNMIEAVRMEAGLSEREKRELLHRGELPRGVNAFYDDTASALAGMDRQQWLATDPFPSRGLTWPASARLPSNRGGAHGFVDPYAAQQLRTQRESMRHASRVKADADSAAIRARLAARETTANRAEVERIQNASPEEIAERDARLGAMLGRTGGARGLYDVDPGAEMFMQREAERDQRRRRRNDELRARAVPPPPPEPVASTKGRPVARIFPPAQRMTQSGVPIDESKWPIYNPPASNVTPGRPGAYAVEAGHGPLSGITTGHTMADVLQGRALAPPAGSIHGEGGLTRFGVDVGSMPQRLAEAGVPRVRDVQTGAYKPATTEQLEQVLKDIGTGRPYGLPSGEGVDLTNLDAPAFQRRQQTMRAADVAGDMLANPELSPRAREQLEAAVAAGTQAGMAGGGGGGRPPAPPSGGPPPDGHEHDEVGRPSPSEKALRRAGLDVSGRRSVAGIDTPQARVADLLSSSREAIAIGRGTGQVRAVGTTAAGAIANLFGGKAQRELVLRDLETLRVALRDFTAEGTQAFEAFDNLNTAKTRLNQARLGGQGDVEALTENLRKAQKEAAPFEETVNAIGEEMDTLERKISGPKQAAIGFAASIAGTIAGLAIFNTVTTGISAAGNAIGSVIERQTGFNNIAAQTTGALSEQTRAMAGYTSGALSAHSATIGLSDASAEFVHSILEQRVAGEAANKNLQEQINLFGSALAVRRQNAEFGGLDRSVFEPTGGANVFGVQTPFGAIPSSQELMGRQLGEGFFNVRTAANQTEINAGMVGGIRGRPAALMEGRPDDAISAEFRQEAEDWVETVDMVNEAIGRANTSTLRWEANIEAVSDTQVRESRRQADLAEQAGLPNVALALRERQGRLLATGLSGSDANQRRQLQQGAAAFQQGALLPNRQEAANQQARPINAQLQLNQAQQQLQRESIIPGQSFLRQLFAGRAPTGGRVDIAPVSQGTAGLPPGVINQPNIDTSQLTAGLAQVETQANKGRSALVGMITAADNINRNAGISSNLLGQFTALTEAAGATAAAIRGISRASAWMQVNLQVKQINEQIFVMSRSLADAKSFLSGVGEGELGILQHRARGLEIAQAELGFRQQELSLLNQQLGVRASSLQLAQRQRQINFQVAIAGFAAPGTSPEERSARLAEAKKEAEFAQQGQNIAVTQLENQKESVALAQQQLGISKEQFAVQQAMVTLSAERAIGDLGRAIGLLQEQARVTVQLQVNSEAIEAYQAVLEEQKAQIESVITEAYTTQQTILSASSSLVAIYGGKITEWNNMLLRSLRDYVIGAGMVIAGVAPAGDQGGNPSNNINDPTSEQVFAPGYLGTVSGATHMTVGEAGPETVAILRNPRSMTLQPQGGGGGPVVINVTVTGNNIRSEQDVDSLTTQIAKKVEIAMGQRAKMLGFGPGR